MSLELVARMFVRERHIPIHKRKLGFVASKEPISLGFFGNRKDNRLVVRKRFLPVSKKNETCIYISEAEERLKLSILYGCLHDYVVALEGVQDPFCKNIQELLLFYHQSYERRKPEVILAEEIAPITYGGVSSLLNSFYPIN